MNKKLIRICLAAIILVAYYGYEQFGPDSSNTLSSSSNDALFQAIDQRLEDIQVFGSATVIKELEDDTHGSRHQRILIKVREDSTILIAHNIDLADRVPNLQRGESISFYGEYIWNDKGGVLHWTHHDPAGRHPDGWLKYQGKTYQ